MEIFYYIAYKKENPNNVCLITSPLKLTSENFNDMKPFLSFNSTNWGGCDEKSRTLKLYNLTLTDTIIYLDEQYYYSGSDYDCGHNYSFNFVFNTLTQCI